MQKLSILNYFIAKVKAIRTTKKLTKVKNLDEKEVVQARPVMQATSEEEINYYVDQYKNDKDQLPHYGPDLCHAARFWIIT